MRSLLEELLSSYLANIDLVDISDNRFRCLIDLYRDLAKEKQPIQEGQAEDIELEAFIKALQDSEI